MVRLVKKKQLGYWFSFRLGSAAGCERAQLVVGCQSGRVSPETVRLIKNEG